MADYNGGIAYFYEIFRIEKIKGLETGSFLLLYFKG